MNYQTAMLLKFCLGSEIHIISLPTPTLPAITAKLPALFRSLPSAYTLSYLDQDGDQIALRSQQDLEVLLKSGAKSAKVLIEAAKEDFLEMGEMTEQVVIMENQEDICVEEEKMEEEKKENVDEQAIIEEKLRKMMPEIVSKIREQMKEERQPKKESPSAPTQPSVVVHESVTCDSCSTQNIQGIRYKCAVCPDFDFCERCEAVVSHPHPFLKIRTVEQTPLKIIAVLRSEDESCTVNGQNIKNLVQHGLDFLKGMVGEQKAEEMKSKFMGMREQWHKQRGGWGCHGKQQTPNCSEKKMEKEEMKEEKKEGMKEDTYDVEMEHIVANANYLMEVFGSEFEHCFHWSQKYPTISRQDLLNACLDDPDFLH